MGVTIIFNAWYLFNSQNNYLYCDSVKDTVGVNFVQGNEMEILLSIQTSLHQIPVGDIVMVR